MKNNLDINWERVVECFRDDDGSLPSIEITKLTPAGVARIYQMIRCRSKLAGNEPPVFWSRMSNTSIPIDAVPNAAVAVADGEAEAFHFTVRGIEVAETELPVLGVFVFADTIELSTYAEIMSPPLA